MPALPWITPQKPSARSEDRLVFGSRFVVTGPRWSGKFMIGTVRMLNQMRQADGCVGLSLKAELIKGHFWTVSVWDDSKKLGEFARSEPHRGISESLSPAMKEVTFNSWKITSDHPLPLKWKDTQQRILAASADESE